MVLYQFSVLLGLDPGLVGLSLAYTITLTGMFQYCVRISAEVENLVSDLFIDCDNYIITWSMFDLAHISGEGDGLWSPRK